MSPVPVASRTAAPAARHAAVLFGVSGLMALAALADSSAHRPALVGVAAADLLTCALALWLPWKRWPLRAALALAVPALAVMAASEALDLIPPRSYGTFYVLLFAWIGGHQGRWVSLWFVPPAVAAYVLPLLPEGTEPPFDPRAVVLTMLVSVLVAETIATVAEQVHDAHSRAARSALLFRAVSRAGSTLTVDDPVALLDHVSDAVMEMGYDGANLALIDDSGETTAAAHGRGVATAFQGASFPLEGTITSRVRDTREPLVTPDYQQIPHAVPAIKAAGIRTTIAVPVYADDRLAAVLHALSLSTIDVTDEDVEALRLLAMSAGTGLEMAARLTSAQQQSRRHEEDAVTDPLTRVGNRRLADQLLDELRPGDTVVLFDLDHFKRVNDLYGHAHGDVVLSSFAGHLAKQVRMGDSIVRYGGEEFLMLLPRTPRDRAQLIVARLLQSWRETSPACTASAGIATHVAGRAVSDTLRAADIALYDAKRDGRDRQSVAP